MTVLGESNEFIESNLHRVLTAHAPALPEFELEDEPAESRFDSFFDVGYVNRNFLDWSIYDRLIEHVADAQTHAILTAFYENFAPPNIPETATRDEIIETLRSRDLNVVADQVVELSGFHEADPGDPDVNVRSLREMTLALVEHENLRSPELTLSEDGFLHAEWPLPDHGRIAATFLPTGRVKFGAISAGALSDKEMLRVGGMLTTDAALDALRWFTRRIA